MASVARVAVDIPPARRRVKGGALREMLSLLRRCQISLPLCYHESLTNPPLAAPGISAAAGASLPARPRRPHRARIWIILPPVGDGTLTTLSEPAGRTNGSNECLLLSGVALLVSGTPAPFAKSLRAARRSSPPSPIASAPFVGGVPNGFHRRSARSSTGADEVPRANPPSRAIAGGTTTAVVAIISNASSRDASASALARSAMRSSRALASSSRSDAFSSSSDRDVFVVVVVIRAFVRGLRNGPGLSIGPGTSNGLSASTPRGFASRAARSVGRAARRSR